ncbi:hypothetical protein [Streptomyces sp. NPDC088785]|uniref:hypothetical protein n=1 Tax=Streptomyces sp. NPDC088785 TaxID=3365897 RepID=UPI00381199BA
MDIDPELHMYDCPGTGPGGRGCPTCAGWEGRSFAEIRRELAAASGPEAVPVVPTQSTPQRPRAEGPHVDHCERLVHEGGVCSCDIPDDYEWEPANMADLEDGGARW